MRISRPLLQSGAVLAALTLGLTGCGSESKKDKEDTQSKATRANSACAKLDNGSTSDSVKVTGDFGKAQKADFKTPLKGTHIEQTILTKGKGDIPASGDKVDVLLTVASGKTGKPFGTQQAAFPVGDAQIPKAFKAGVECVPIGSRTVVTVPAKDVYGAQGNPQAGIAADDTMVIISDVIDKVKPLKPVEWKDAPKVTFGKDGKPSVKLTGKPATALELKVLQQGNGTVVKDGDQVTVDYQGTSWNTGKVFDQSYGKQPATFGTDQVVKGFGAALVGQKVGTKLIVTIPPQYAYGTTKSAGQLGGQTLVFVIDIKGTKPAE